MPRVLPKTCPLDYSLCSQTVTVYHQDAAKRIFRTVVRSAHLEFRKSHTLDKTGSKEANAFLLVVPEQSCAFVPPGEYTGAEGTFTLAPLDKVQLGEGPELPDAAAWAAHIPARVDGLAVIRYVDPRFWHGARCHVEAGG